jgi:3-oxoacyl-[acyl-carrier protein] reductase
MTRSPVACSRTSMSQRTLITGSTRGIGLAVARAILAADGFAMITGRTRESVDEAVYALQATGVGDRVAGCVLDVGNATSASAAVDATLAAFGGLDVVVNNAGVGIYGAVEATTDGDWQTTIDTNLTGPFFVMRAAIPVLRRAGGGWVVNIASLAGASPFAGGGAYCASKAGLIALSESAMAELRHDNIRVSVVLPGSVATRFSPNQSGDDSWKLAPEDVAEVVMDLLRHPARSLPSRVEIRPSRPRKA